jgi:hypothetical protein
MHLMRGKKKSHLLQVTSAAAAELIKSERYFIHLMYVKPSDIHNVYYKPITTVDTKEFWNDLAEVIHNAITNGGRNSVTDPYDTTVPSIDLDLVSPNIPEKKGDVLDYSHITNSYDFTHTNDPLVGKVVNLIEAVHILTLFLDEHKNDVLNNYQNFIAYFKYQDIFCKWVLIILKKFQDWPGRGRPSADYRKEAIFLNKLDNDYTKWSSKTDYFMAIPIALETDRKYHDTFRTFLHQINIQHYF